AVALMLDQRVQLWIDPSDRTPHVSVIVGKHCENFRVGDRGFEDWLRAEYGRRHWTSIEVGGLMQRVPAPMSIAVLSEAVATVRALAVGREQFVPALRVGGIDGEVWLDLGTENWELIQVTAGGWRLVLEGVPAVRFIRKAGMLPLPIPVHGGSIWE